MAKQRISMAMQAPLALTKTAQLRLFTSMIVYSLKTSLIFTAGLNYYQNGNHQFGIIYNNQSKGEYRDWGAHPSNDK